MSLVPEANLGIAQPLALTSGAPLVNHLLIIYRFSISLPLDSYRNDMVSLLTSPNCSEGLELAAKSLDILARTTPYGDQLEAAWLHLHLTVFGCAQDMS